MLRAGLVKCAATIVDGLLLRFRIAAREATTVYIHWIRLHIWVLIVQGSPFVGHLFPKRPKVLWQNLTYLKILHLKSDTQTGRHGLAYLTR